MMEGFVKVEVERAIELANNVLDGVKLARKKMYEKEISRIITRNEQKNSHWMRKFDKRKFSTKREDAEKEIEKDVQHMRKSNNIFLTYDTKFNFLYSYSSVEGDAEDILTLCKVPPADNILTLDSSMVIKLMAWQKYILRLSDGIYDLWRVKMLS